MEGRHRKIESAHLKERRHKRHRQPTTDVQQLHEVSEKHETFSNQEKLRSSKATEHIIAHGDLQRPTTKHVHLMKRHSKHESPVLYVTKPKSGTARHPELDTNDNIMQKFEKGMKSYMVGLGKIFTFGAVNGSPFGESVISDEKMEKFKSGDKVYSKRSTKFDYQISSEALAKLGAHRKGAKTAENKVHLPDGVIRVSKTVQKFRIDEGGQKEVPKMKSKKLQVSLSRVVPALAMHTFMIVDVKPEMPISSSSTSEMTHEEDELQPPPPPPSPSAPGPVPTLVTTGTQPDKNSDIGQLEERKIAANFIRYYGYLNDDRHLVINPASKSCSDSNKLYRIPSNEERDSYSAPPPRRLGRHSRIPISNNRQLAKANKSKRLTRKSAPETIDEKVHILYAEPSNSTLSTQHRDPTTNNIGRRSSGESSYMSRDKISPDGEILAKKMMALNRRRRYGNDVRRRTLKDASHTAQAIEIRFMLLENDCTEYDKGRPSAAIAADRIQSDLLDNSIIPLYRDVSDQHDDPVYAHCNTNRNFESASVSSLGTILRENDAFLAKDFTRWYDFDFGSCCATGSSLGRSNAKRFGGKEKESHRSETDTETISTFRSYETGKSNVEQVAIGTETDRNASETDASSGVWTLKSKEANSKDYFEQPAIKQLFHPVTTVTSTEERILIENVAPRKDVTRFMDNGNKKNKNKRYLLLLKKILNFRTNRSCDSDAD